MRTRQMEARRRVELRFGTPFAEVSGTPNDGPKMVGVAGLEPALKLFRKEIDCPLPRLPFSRYKWWERPVMLRAHSVSQTDMLLLHHYPHKWSEWRDSHTREIGPKPIA